MLNLAILALLPVLILVVIARLVADARADRSARASSQIHREPVIDNHIATNDHTDNYYQPAESTDESIDWLAHQFRKDPVIWDSQDDGFYDNAANRDFSIRIRRKIRLKYFDREGQDTLRQIDTLRLGESVAGEPQVLAYCHTYMRNVTFRVASMSDCVDLDTGLKIADVVEFLRSEYAASAQASCDTAFAEYLDVFRVLAFIDQAGGYTDQRVLAVMTAVCRQIADDERIAESMVGDALKSVPPMNNQQFEIAVSRFTQMKMPIDMPEVAAAMLAAMKRPGRHAYQAKAYIDMRARLPVPL